MYTNMKMSGVHAANLKGHVLLLIIWILALAFYIFKVIVSLSWQKAFFQVEKKICGKVPFFLKLKLLLKNENTDLNK